MIALGLGAVGLLATFAWNLSLVPRLVVDDAFIFLRYARTWVEHGTLAFNPGTTGTDGFTSFTYQLVVALAYALSPTDVVASTWWTCVAIGGAVVLAGFVVPAWASIRAQRRVTATLAAAMMATLLTTALSSTFAYWTQSLMDAVLLSLAALTASLALAHLRATERLAPWRAALAAVTMVFFTLTRPEAFLVGAILVVLLLTQTLMTSPRRILAITSCGIVFAMAAYFTWHLHRYHSPFPNPIYVKAPGMDLASIGGGLRYVTDGPAVGMLPDGSFRSHIYDGGIRQASRQIDIVNKVRLVGTLVSVSWLPFHLAMVLVAPVLFGLTFWPRLWRDRRAAVRIRSLLLIPLGLWTVVILDGGDSFHVGWRMITPELPTVFMALALVVPCSSGRWAARAVLAFLSVLVLVLLATTVRRPAACAETASACGWDALRGGATRLTTYVWDQSMGTLDAQVGHAIEASFPPGTVIGQSDDQRLSAHIDLPVLDLSGLVNAELAHSEKGAATSRFSTRALVDTQPDVYIYGWHLWQPNALYRFALDDPRAGAFLFPWMPIGADGARRFAEIPRLYVGASVRVAEGGYMNFLVHRAVIPRMLRRDLVLVGP